MRGALSQIGTDIFTTDEVVCFTYITKIPENTDRLSETLIHIHRKTRNRIAELADLNVTERKCVFERSPICICVQLAREYRPNKKMGYYHKTSMTFLNSIKKNIEIDH